MTRAVDLVVAMVFTAAAIAVLARWLPVPHA